MSTTTEIETKTQTTELASFDAMLADFQIAVRPIMAIKVKDYETEKQILSAGGQIKTLQKSVDARKKELIAPLKARIQQIELAAGRVSAVLAEPELYVRTQINAYAQEVERKRQEELRKQRDREEAERKAAAEKRAKEEAELRAKQEAEIKARQEAEAVERKRIEDERLAAIKAAEEEAARKSRAANLFGGGQEAQDLAKRKAAESKRIAEEEAARAEREAQAQAQAERDALAAHQERERLADEARLAREESERQEKLAEERRAIEAQRVKGGKTELNIEVIDPWAIPRDLVRPPEVDIPAVKKAYKQGRKDISGLKITEEIKVSIRAESVPGMRALA